MEGYVGGPLVEALISGICVLFANGTKNRHIMKKRPESDVLAFSEHNKSVW